MAYKNANVIPRPRLATKAHPDMAFEAPLSPTLFRPEGVTMLADVRAKVELMPSGNGRRDILSAFNVLAARAFIDLSSTPASAQSRGAGPGSEAAHHQPLHRHLPALCLGPRRRSRYWSRPLQEGQRGAPEGGYFKEG